MPKRRGRRRARWFSWLLLGLLGISGYLGWQVLGNSAFFKVTQVEVRGDSRQIITGEIMTSVRGQSLIFFPAEAVGKHLSQNLLISRVDFDRQFPGKIIATVHYREPVLSWQSQTGRFLISRDGVAYALSGSEQVPQVSDPTSRLELGDTLSSVQVGTTLNVLKAISERFTVLTMSIKGRDVLINLSSGTLVSLDGAGDLTRQVSALQLILSQAKIEGRLPKTIDLRFSKPVVTF